MNFLVYASHDEDNIQDSLGMADYSYYFVMKRYLPLLAEYGSVELLSRPADDKFIADHPNPETCIYLSFTPPDKTAQISLCPVFVVFAWEFSTIPDEEFTRPEDDWVRDLKILGRAITHSTYAVAVVKNQLGENFAIDSIPAPLWNACEPIRVAREKDFPRGLAGVDLSCRAIDSASYELSNTYVRPKTVASEFTISPLGHEWAGVPLDLSFCAGSSTSSLIGFNKPEEWGVWSKPGYPWLLLNELIGGHIELELTLQGYAQNVGERLQIEFGSACAHLLLKDCLTTYVFNLHIEKPTNVMAFVGVIEKARGMVDPRDIGFGLSHLSIRRIEEPQQAPINLNLDFSESSLVLDGFYPAEPNGRWTASSRCIIFLPQSVSGDVKVAIELACSPHNEGRVVDLSLGGCKQSLTLDSEVSSYELNFPDSCASSYLIIEKLLPGPTGHEGDPRSIGVFISSLRLGARKSESAATHVMLDPGVPEDSSQDSILYTTILNPMDARKNWEDIITAFVYAFRDNPNVCLLMKISHHDFDCFFEDIFTFFTELYPFQCRLIFIHGFLADQEFSQLIQHSHFIVNASTGEGQCLPLMEFMAAGVPAIAPCHTAMLDYINPSNTFIVSSSAEPTCWPQDPRYVYRAQCQRINWEALRDAFIESENVFRRSRSSYLGMSVASIDSLEKYCSMERSREKFTSVSGWLSFTDGWLVCG